jgi:hypothetical protein
MSLFKFLTDKIESNQQKLLSVNVIIRLMLSLCLCPKVITLSGFHCIIIFFFSFLDILFSRKIKLQLDLRNLNHCF